MKESKSSIHFRPVKSNSENHNLRRSKLEYVMSFLTKDNKHWSERNIATEKKYAENYCKKTSGRKLQKNATIIREAVVNIKSTTTMEDLKILSSDLKAKFGLKVFQIHIHRDEGRKSLNRYKTNHHAHLVALWQDHSTGKCLRLNRKNMSEMQDLTAELLRMERGVKVENSNVKRLEATEYKEQEALKREQKALKKLELLNKSIDDLEIKAQETEAKARQTTDFAMLFALEEKKEARKEAKTTADKILNNARNEAKNEADKILNNAKEEAANLKTKENEALQKLKLSQVKLNNLTAEALRMEEEKAEIKKQLSELRLQLTSKLDPEEMRKDLDIKIKWRLKKIESVEKELQNDVNFSQKKGPSF